MSKKFPKLLLILSLVFVFLGFASVKAETKTADTEGTVNEAEEEAPQPSPTGGGIALPPVSTICQGNVYQNLGGEIRCTLESGQQVVVVFPSYSAKGTIMVKIEPKNKTEIIKTNLLPENTQIIGDLAADFKAISGGKELEKFKGVVQITFTYSDEQVKKAEVDEETLKIYWWDDINKIWESLRSKVNTEANTVRAYTIHFTLFTVMGEMPVELTIFEKIQQKIVEIRAKITDLRTQIAQFFKKKAVVEVPKIPPEEISPEELPPAEKISAKEEIITPSEKPSLEKVEAEPINLFKEYGRWFWQQITNLGQKIWPF